MIKVNAIGQTCPMPVIMAKKALKEITEGIVEVAVDNIISRDNVEKMAKEMGYSTTTASENDIYTITIVKKINSETLHANSVENTVIVVDSDTMGKGDEVLGKTLIKGFFYTLTEMETLPKTILFYNRGVFLTSEAEETIADLKLLEERGVEILSCGACANFYNLQHKIQVGTITNMLTIIERQMKSTRIIKP